MLCVAPITGVGAGLFQKANERPGYFWQADIDCEDQYQGDDRGQPVFIQFKLHGSYSSTYVEYRIYLMTGLLPDTLQTTEELS